MPGLLRVVAVLAVKPGRGAGSTPFRGCSMSESDISDLRQAWRAGFVESDSDMPELECDAPVTMATGGSAGMLVLGGWKRAQAMKHLTESLENDSDNDGGDNEHNDSDEQLLVQEVLSATWSRGRAAPWGAAGRRFLSSSPG